MSNDDLKLALTNKLPVKLEDTIYTKINAIIYRPNKSGKIIVYAELQDKCGNSISTVPASFIEFAEPPENMKVAEMINDIITKNLG